MTAFLFYSHFMEYSEVKGYVGPAYPISAMTTHVVWACRAVCNFQG